MPHLIVGDTTDHSVRLWVRGDTDHREAEVALRSATPGNPPPQKISLSKGADYTGIAVFDDLTPDAPYQVTGTFPAVRGEEYVRGEFRTLPADQTSFSFILASCNLSVSKISDLTALLVSKAGVAAAGRSLSLPFERWQFWAPDWLKRLLRGVTYLLVWGTAWVVSKTTAVKQPAPPYLRSPFLKLSAVFDSWILQLTDVDDRHPLPGVGNLVLGPGGRGIVACSIIELPKEAKRETRTDGNAGAKEDEPTPRRWQLVLTQIEGTFKSGDVVTAADETRVGTIKQAKPAKPWFERPSFFLHAGDQIYYDFPFDDRRPDRNQYRLTYRETWFDDDAARHVLSHWPHYMTLDDHEIADQFDRAFKPPLPDVTANEYLEEAVAAYREYVHSRNPPPIEAASLDESGRDPLWYSFSKGRTHFFVLDTRTRRVGDIGQMIDKDQLTHLLQWLRDHKDDLKFIVTSVPFVAEVDDGEKRRHRSHPSSERQAERSSPDWYEPRNPANDKWSSKRFEKQRHKIIDFIGRRGIERVVFLTGDMHCCYHATMRIFHRREECESPATPQSKYASVTVHELAGGPVNQLMMGDIDEFCVRRSGRASKRFVYDVVLDRFHTQVNAVVHVKVAYPERDDVRSANRQLTPEIEWNVIRTLTDARSWDAWWEAALPDEPAPKPSELTKAGEPTMNGRISFLRKRTTDRLARW